MQIFHGIRKGRLQADKHGNGQRMCEMYVRLEHMGKWLF